MILEWMARLGAWGWLVFGMILLSAEILMPGVFLIWIGLAAMVVGLLSLALWETSWWVWEVQILIFAALSVISVLMGRRYLIQRGGATTDEPYLNQRGEGLVGRIVTLKEPIIDGRGRIHIDDTVWIVEGPDLMTGERVKVMAADGRGLKVEKI